MRAEAPVPVGERSIVAGPNHHGVCRRKEAVSPFDRRGDLAKRDVIPFGIDRMRNPELLIRRPGDPNAGFGEFPSFLRCNPEAH